jgi:hypothetical protein
MTASANSVPSLLKEIVRNARTGDTAAASSLLNRAILLMQEELGTGTVAPAVVARVTSFLDALLSAQKRGDWVAFADVLEYDFTPFWEKSFTSLG